MEKVYCVLSLQKIKHMGGLERRYEHNFRLGREIPNALIENETQVNEELVNKTGMDYIELWHRRVQESELETGVPIKIRQNASVLAYEIVTTFSREADIDIDEWKEANVRWMKNTFGEKNVLSMQLHRDEEGCEHIHSIVIPIDSRGRLCAKSFTGGRKCMYGLHDSYARAMAPFGLSRGERYSTTKKENVRRFYAAVDDAVSFKIPQKLEEEPIQEYTERVNDYLQEMKLSFLKERRQKDRQIELEQTKLVQTTIGYDAAIKLQDFLCRKLNSKEAAKKRLALYLELEKNIPPETYEKLLYELSRKFSPKSKEKDDVLSVKESNVDKKELIE